MISATSARCRALPHIAAILGLALLLLALLGGAPAFARTPLPERPSLEIMAGQMLMVGFRGTGDEPLSPDLVAMLPMIRSGQLGGVILFDLDWQTRKRGRNITSAVQVKKLTELLHTTAPMPLFIAVDQEGGAVRRLKPEHGVPATPSAAELGKATPQATRDAAKALGHRLRALGINVDFAPVADVAVIPHSPAIGALNRAFSHDPALVAAHAAQFAKGLGDAGIVAAYKHFPGHGSALADTHHGFTDTSTTWSKRELAPYEASALPQGAPLMVMTGHLFNSALDPELPASLSKRVVTDLLRRDLGWQGVVVTDDMQMRAITSQFTQKQAVRLAVLSGTDILLSGNNLAHSPDEAQKLHAILMDLVKQGEISEERMYQSWQRIRALKMRL